MMQVHDQFKYHVPLPSLVEMSSNQVAQSTWYSYISQSNGIVVEENSYDRLLQAFGLNKNYEEESIMQMKYLNLPKSVKEMIENSLSLIISNTKKWIEYFNYNISSTAWYNKLNINKPNLNWFVWLPDGTIDYKKTALNMIRSSELSELQKFSIMSKCCLENELKSFALDSIIEFLKKHITFQQDYLLYYWLCYLTNELHKIPFDGYQSIGHKIIMKIGHRSGQLITFYYFWNKMDAEQQVSIATQIFKPFDIENRIYTMDAPEQLFSDMSWHQQRELMFQIPEHLIWSFFQRSELPQCALWIWERVKNSINMDQFTYMVSTIETEIHYSYCSALNPISVKTFFKMWDTADIYLKKHTLSIMESVVISYIFQKKYSIEWECSGFNIPPNYLEDDIVSISSPVFRFVLKFLSFCDDKWRQKLFLQNAVSFATIIDDPCHVDEIINLCLMDPKDKPKLKQHIMDSNDMKKHCINLFNRSDFQRLNQKLFAYLSDSDSAITEFKKWLLLSDAIHPYDAISNVAKWNEMCTFIEHVFPNDPPLFLRLKKKLIFSIINANDCRYFRSSRFDVFLSILHMVLDAEELKSTKKSLQKRLVCAIRSHMWWEVDYDEQNFHIVRQWCYGDDAEAIQKFKNDLSIDQLFYVYLSFSQGTIYSDSIAPLHKGYRKHFDKYFLWYLGSDDEIKKYKLNWNLLR